MDIENQASNENKRSYLEKLLSQLFDYFNLLVTLAFSKPLLIEFISSVGNQVDKIIELQSLVVLKMEE